MRRGFLCLVFILTKLEAKNFHGSWFLVKSAGMNLEHKTSGQGSLNSGVYFSSFTSVSFGSGS